MKKVKESLRPWHSMGISSTNTTVLPVSRQKGSRGVASSCTAPYLWLPLTVSLPGRELLGRNIQVVEKLQTKGLKSVSISTTTNPQQTGFLYFASLFTRHWLETHIAVTLTASSQDMIG